MCTLPMGIICTRRITRVRQPSATSKFTAKSRVEENHC
jgi:hypothetical protein